ncbi:hypothetical protein TNCV_4826431 [Trichonephila clavipes]|nr:hypothetical protein TNCV_4826431 [Trichonephila clavipes]
MIFQVCNRPHAVSKAVKRGKHCVADTPARAVFKGLFLLAFISASRPQNVNQDSESKYEKSDRHETFELN